MTIEDDILAFKLEASHFKVIMPSKGAEEVRVAEVTGG